MRYVLKQGDVLVAWKTRAILQHAEPLLIVITEVGAVNLWDAVFPGDLVFEPELPMGVHSFFALKFGYMKNGFVSSSHVSIVVLTTEKTSRNFIKVPFF